MSHHRNRRLPRAHVDPITNECDALAIVRRLGPQPPRSATMLLVLDDLHRGVAVTTVTSPPAGDELVPVVGRVLGALHAAGAGGRPALIAATFRPEPIDGSDDATSWHVVAAECEAAGFDLIEWFVLGDVVRRPRELVGQPPRWRADGGPSGGSGRGRPGSPLGR